MTWKWHPVLSLRPSECSSLFLWASSSFALYSLSTSLSTSPTNRRSSTWPDKLARLTSLLISCYRSDPIGALDLDDSDLWRNSTRNDNSSPVSLSHHYSNHVPSHTSSRALRTHHKPSTGWAWMGWALEFNLDHIIPPPPFHWTFAPQL